MAVVALSLLASLFVCNAASATMTVSLSANPGSWMGLCNNAIQLKALTSGGTGEATYQFLWRKNPSGPSGDSGSPTSNAAWNWTPSSSGQYGLKVIVRQGSDEATGEIQYVVALAPVSLDVSPTTNVSKVSSIQARGNPPATCIDSSDTLKYKFLSRRQPPGGSWEGWKTLQDWGSSSSVNFNPDGDGYLTVQVRVGIFSGSTLLAETAKSSDPIVVAQAPLKLDSLTVAPVSVVGGRGDLTGTVRLTVQAPVGGTTVGLQSSAAEVQVPSSLAIAQGSQEGTFTAKTKGVVNSKAVTVKATFSPVERAASLQLLPVTVSSIKIKDTDLIGGKTTTITITLSDAAPAIGTSNSGVPVTLSTSPAPMFGAPYIRVPATVTVDPGSTSTSFEATSISVTGPTRVTIAARVGDSSEQSATITLHPSP